MASTSLLIGGLIASAAGGVASSAIQSHAAGKAADAQTQAANHAADEQAQAANESLQLQQEILGQTTANQSPFIDAGTGALNLLTKGLGVTPTATNDVSQQVINNAARIASNNPYGIGVNPPAGAPAVPQYPGARGTTGMPLTPAQQAGQLAPTSNGPASKAVNPAVQPLNAPASQVQTLSPATRTASFGPTAGPPSSLPISAPVNGLSQLNPAALPSFQLDPTGAGSAVNARLPRLVGAPRPIVPNNPANVAGGAGAAGTVGQPPAVDVNGVPLNTQGNLNATSLNEQWATPFTAPTADQAAATPGEQFMLDTGRNAIQNSAAANGNLLSGSTLKGLDAFSQNLASTGYQQAFNNALQNYQQNYNIFNQNQGTSFNRLASLAGLGQTSVGQLSSAGENAATTGSSTLMGAAGAIGQAQQNAAAATASGYVGGANATAGGINSVASAASLPFYLQALQARNLGVADTGANIPIAG